MSWRDLAHPQAGGSEILVDRLLRQMLDRGHEAALLAGGPVAQRPYAVTDLGGTYAQYLRAPFALRRFRDWDVLVDVENGLPYFSPWWRKGPIVCMVHHVHAEQWRLRFPLPVAAVGRFVERHVMPRVYRHSLYVTVSASTRDALIDIGVDEAQIRLLSAGVDPPSVKEPKADEPQFLALGRLVPHKRIDLLLRVWARVRPQVGGTLVIAGDGPEGARLRGVAADHVKVLGAVSEPDKQRLLSRSWLLVHTALHEGWGLVVMEAAAAGTPALAMNVRGIRDAVVDGSTGVLVRDEDEMVERWVALARDPAWRQRLGQAAAARAATFTWEASGDTLEEIALEAMERAGRV